MTPESLLNLIENDETALALASSGNMVACAERCVEIAPLEFFSQQVTDQGLYQLYPGGPIAVEQILYKLEQSRDYLMAYPTSQQEFWLGRVLKRALDQIADKDDGIDFSLPTVQTMLATLVSFELITQTESNNLSNTCKRKPTITHEDCSHAWSLA